MVGQWVIAAASGEVRQSRPYGDGSASDNGICIRTMGGVDVCQWYLQPLPGVVGSAVLAGDVIGRLLPHRDPAVTPHCHLETRIAGKAVAPEVEA
jgi:hypothetical protein